MVTVATPSKSPRAADATGGLIRVHKPGQGFWTRLGTGIGAGLIILFTVQWLYRRLPTWTALTGSDLTLFAILGVVTLVLAAVAWWLVNRPRHADFLINTDGEMKKVTWPTRAELVGSTKVVVGFMFFTAAVLFGYDQVFGLFFWAIDVLRILPPVFEGLAG